MCDVMIIDKKKFIEMIYENLFDDSMNSSVALFDSIGNLSSSYKIIETNSSLERFNKPYESKIACTQLRRLFLCIQFLLTLNDYIEFYLKNRTIYHSNN